LTHGGCSKLGESLDHLRPRSFNDSCIFCGLEGYFLRVVRDSVLQI